MQKEMFPVYGGKCLLLKAVLQLGGKIFAVDEDVDTKVQK
jgi:hypothetical protein